MISILQLLKNHLAVAHATAYQGNTSLGTETTSLRNFLFGCLDRDFPTEISDLIESCVSAGAQLLMPDIEGRVEVLLRVLPESNQILRSMSRGKRAQLEIILKSLEKNDGLPSLLNVSANNQNSICLKFMKALLNSWEKLTSLRHLTHPLLKKMMLYMASAGKKRVSVLFKYICRKKIK